MNLTTRVTLNPGTAGGYAGQLELEFGGDQPAASRPYSGMRPLSEVLDQTRVMRAKRAESEDEGTGYVYGTRWDGTGTITEWPITKWTPKRVWFATSQERWRGLLLHVGYADREQFECGKPAVVMGAGPPGYGYSVYSTRAAARNGRPELRRLAAREGAAATRL